MKISKRIVICLCLVLVSLVACDPSMFDEPVVVPTDVPEPPTQQTDNACEVTAIPDEVRSRHKLNPFYKKYTDANGIPVFSSEKPDDEALMRACEMLKGMLSKRDDIRQEMINAKVRFAIIGVDEQTTDIPEYSHYGSYMNIRARGLGGAYPTSCAEENILCGPSDRWRGESICLHEFAHVVADYGIARADANFKQELNSAFSAARSSGHFANTYAISQPAEYWAEGVQSFYNTNLESRTGRADGVHNSIDTREELRAADPGLYELISKSMPAEITWEDCYQD